MSYLSAIVVSATTAESAYPADGRKNDLVRPCQSLKVMMNIFSVQNGSVSGVE